MTRYRLSCGSRYNQGFSLIELMVSLVIGLIISVAAFSAYLGASKAARMAEAQGRMNEDAQAALAILTQQLRMAGNNPKQPNRISACPRNPVYSPTIFPNLACTASNVSVGTGTFMVKGCDGPFADPPNPSVSGIDTLSCKTTTSTLPDSIAISYEADRYNTVPTASPDFKPTDCLGQSIGTVTFTIASGPSSITSTTSTAVADNRFYIDTSKVILSPSLYCKGNGGLYPQPLVENIDDMQITYGAVKPLTPSNQVNTATVAGYLSADEVLNSPKLAPLLLPEERWAKVVTVRICVVARSEKPMVSDADSAKYRNCKDTLVSATDLRLRRAYSTTVVLRNRRLYEPPLTPPP